jgi:hypothetical protein
MMGPSRRERVVAATAHFRLKGAVAPAGPPPAERPTLPLKLKPPSPAMPPARPPAGARSAKSRPAAAQPLPGEAQRPPGAPAGATPPKSYSVAELRALVAWMRQTWPAAFGEQVLPLAIGAGAEIARARPQGCSHKDIESALRFHTNSDAYLAALAAEGSRRIRLDGGDGGEVDEGHRQHARERLAERKATRRGVKAP